MHFDLIRQSHSYEADYRRDYRPSPQQEQYILDVIPVICLSIDTFVISTIVSHAYFPEHVSTCQNTALLILFSLFVGRYIGEFLWQLRQHHDFVSSKKQFTVRTSTHSTLENIYELVWKNPTSLLDFRTVQVLVGQRYISDHSIIPRPIPPADPIPPVGPVLPVGPIPPVGPVPPVDPILPVDRFPPVPPNEGRLHLYNTRSARGRRPAPVA